jgi:hypothetical protein
VSTRALLGKVKQWAKVGECCEEMLVFVLKLGDAMKKVVCSYPSIARSTFQSYCFRICTYCELELPIRGASFTDLGCNTLLGLCEHGETRDHSSLARGVRRHSERGPEGRIQGVACFKQRIHTNVV